MQDIRENHPLRRFFAGLVEHTFEAELGICDPKITDYVSTLLVDFTHVDRLHLLKDAEGRRLEHIGRMLTALDEGLATIEAEAHHVVHRHIGDYALFWAGLYPERLRAAKRSTFCDHLIDYVAVGKRAYAIASSLTPTDCMPPADLLNRLSFEFEGCVHGLNRLRQCCQHQQQAAPTELGQLLF